MASLESRLEKLEAACAEMQQKIYILMPGEPLPDDPDGHIIQVKFVEGMDGQPANYRQGLT